MLDTNEIVESYFDENNIKIPEKIQSTINQTNSDLHHGMATAENYAGFAKSVAVISNWFQSHTRIPSQLWYSNVTGYATYLEPDWRFEEPEDFCVIDYGEIKKSILGRELAEYV